MIINIITYTNLTVQIFKDLVPGLRMLS